MTRDELLAAAAELADVEDIPTVGPVRHEAMIRYLDRLSHVVNLLYAAESKEQEVIELRLRLKNANAPQSERTTADIAALRQQLRVYLGAPRFRMR